VKKELEIELEKLSGFDSPNLRLEQYATPPSLAAFIVSQAYLFSDLNSVIDLGCGTGMLAIASAKLGARVLGIDIDRRALLIAKENSRKLKVKVDLIQADVRRFWVKKRGFTTIMNPPFGIKKKHADRPFLIKALEISRVIYSIHSAGSERFVKRLTTEMGFIITHLWRFSIPLRRTYEFHEKEFKYIPIEVYRIERNCAKGVDIK
jgi:putative methylase